MASKEYIVPSSPAGLRILLVGKTGSGKSAAGNTILGRESEFKSEPSPESVTKECRIEEVKSGETTISVTDTPGVCDTDLGVEALRHELESCIYMTAPGPHVFLLVIRVGVRYNREEKDAVQWICDNFGKEALEYAIVLFTHTDELGAMTLKQYVEKSIGLRKLIKDCGSRFHGFNNNDRSSNQVCELLQKIKQMMEINRARGKECYTNEIYKRAQEQIEYASVTSGADLALGFTSGAGAVTAAAGVGLGATKILVLPGLIIGGSGIAVAAGGTLLLKKLYERHQRRNTQRQTQTQSKNK